MHDAGSEPRRPCAAAQTRHRQPERRRLRRLRRGAGRGVRREETQRLRLRGMRGRPPAGAESCRLRERRHRGVVRRCRLPGRRVPLLRQRIVLPGADPSRRGDEDGGLPRALLRQRDMRRLGVVPRQHPRLRALGRRPLPHRPRAHRSLPLGLPLGRGDPRGFTPAPASWPAPAARPSRPPCLAIGAASDPQARLLRLPRAGLFLRRRCGVGPVRQLVRLPPPGTAPPSLRARGLFAGAGITRG